jgi:hypothetical protein
MKIQTLIDSGVLVFSLSALDLLKLGISSQDCLEYLNNIKKNTPDYHRNMRTLKEEPNLLNLSEADFESFASERAKWLSDFSNAKKLCSTMFNFFNEQSIQMLEGAAQKYYKKTSFHISSYPGVDCTLDDLKRAKKDLIFKKQRERAAAIENGSLVTPEMVDAMDFLKDYKLYPKQDYEPKDALAKALEVKLDILIQEEDGKEQEISFCDCGKWIAGERRCSCGNVRVYWSHYSPDESFKNVIIIPAQD